MRQKKKTATGNIIQERSFTVIDGHTNTLTLANACTGHTTDVYICTGAPAVTNAHTLLHSHTSTSDNIDFIDTTCTCWACCIRQTQHVVHTLSLAVKNTMNNTTRTTHHSLQNTSPPCNFSSIPTVTEQCCSDSGTSAMAKSSILVSPVFLFKAKAPRPSIGQTMPRV